MVWYTNRIEACIAETTLIYAVKPRYNKLQQWSANLPQRTTDPDCELRQPMITYGATRPRLGGGRMIPNTTGIWAPTWSG